MSTTLANEQHHNPLVEQHNQTTMIGGGTMDKLISNLCNLCNLLETGKPELIDFDLLIGAYTRKKVDATSIQLNDLEQAGLLTFEREEFGFRIKINNIGQLKNSQIATNDKEVSEK